MLCPYKALAENMQPNQTPRISRTDVKRIRSERRGTIVNIIEFKRLMNVLCVLSNRLSTETLLPGSERRALSARRTRAGRVRRERSELHLNWIAARQARMMQIEHVRRDAQNCY